jgi:hypothetical protein
MARDEENRMLLRAIGQTARMCPACGTVIERASGDHQVKVSTEPVNSERWTHIFIGTGTGADTGISVGIESKSPF